MSIDTIYQSVQLIVNKYRDGYIGPDEFNVFVNMAQRELFDAIIGVSETYRYDKPLPRDGKMYNKLNIEKLAPFAKTASIAIAENGKITKPSGYSRHISMYLSDNTIVKYVAQNKVAGYLDDSIDPVSITKPIAVEMGSYFQLFPISGWASGTQIQLQFYQAPPVAKWSYTNNSDGEPVYDASTSIQPVWSDSEVNDLISLIVKYAGINLSNGQIIQFSEMQKQTGS